MDKILLVTIILIASCYIIVTTSLTCEIRRRRAARRELEVGTSRLVLFGGRRKMVRHDYYDGSEDHCLPQDTSNIGGGISGGTSSGTSGGTNSGESSGISGGTMYITVGPQCAGKTSHLKELFKSGGIDVSIDDQELVYLPIPTSYFLHEDAPNNNDAPLLSRTLFGKTIRERIFDSSQNELRCVLQRLNNQITRDQFLAKLLQQQQQQQQQSSPNNATTIHSSINSVDSTIYNDLTDAVESFLKQQQKQHSKIQCLPDTTDLFIVESIFQPRPIIPTSNDSSFNNNNSNSNSNNCSALDAAMHQLQTHASFANNLTSPRPPKTTAIPKAKAKVVVVAWGNTNTRPREYKYALEIAERMSLTVHFIIFAGWEATLQIINSHSKKDPSKPSSSLPSSFSPIQSHCIPKVSRRVLLQRNILRLIQTGRYVPSTAIHDAMVRTESMVSMAVASAIESTKTSTNSSSSSNNDITTDIAKFRLDYELTKLAGYHMNENRTVSKNFSVSRGKEYNRADSRRKYSNHTRGQYNNNNHRGREGGRYSNINAARGNYNNHGREGGRYSNNNTARGNYSNSGREGGRYSNNNTARGNYSNGGREGGRGNYNHGRGQYYNRGGGRMIHAKNTQFNDNSRHYYGNRSTAAAAAGHNHWNQGRGRDVRGSRGSWNHHANPHHTSHHANPHHTSHHANPRQQQQQQQQQQQHNHVSNLEEHPPSGQKRRHPNNHYDEWEEDSDNNGSQQRYYYRSNQGREHSSWNHGRNWYGRQQEGGRGGGRQQGGRGGR